MSSAQKDENNQWGLAAVLVGAISAAIFFVNYNISNWKAASANMHKAFIMAPEASSLPVPVDLAFMTNTLTGFGVLYEPIARSPITGLAALEVEKERYRRGSKGRGSWNTVSTDYAFAEPVNLGAVRLSQHLIRNDAQEAWRSFSAIELQNSKLHRSMPRALFSGSRIYPDGSSRGYAGNERYTFRGIYAPQQVTVIARAEPDAVTGQLTFIPSPLMPSGYPAVWLGERTPSDILKILYSRFANTMMAMAGLLFFTGWALFVLIDALLYGKNRTPKSLLAGGALAATFAGLGLWYAFPIAGIAIPCVLGSFAALFILCRIGMPDRSRFS